ncbi:MAG: orotate phosphoribosyltransferase [Bacteroides sp. SM23_62_1]|nr:MAG: orotate phosphoribosyltransferase [Bacteroides sp. SM23_62_1]
MEISKKLAGYLLQIKAIIIDPAKPFTWSSGWKSPIYCDNRKTLSHPEIRDFIRDQLTSLIQDRLGIPDMIAGVATGAIAQGALVADKLHLPFVYVRSSAKDHGTGNIIEGEVTPGRSVVVVEDLVSTGGSSLRAADALREAGLNLLGMVAIFTYGFKTAEDNFRNAGITLHTITDYHTLITHGVSTGYVQPRFLETLKEWRENPAQWGKN